jgi:adenosylhomocysteinase
MGASVIVTEIDPIKALEAVMDGFAVMPMQKAAAAGDVFCTVTGNVDVITDAHFTAMKDGAIVCNSGHFDVEINLKELRALAGSDPVTVRENVQQYTIGTKRIYILAEGRLVNLAAAEGHPASVMDMSFATQALASAWMATQAAPLKPGVYDVPLDMEERIATLKLAAMGQTIDRLTDSQKEYLNSWQHGT